MVSADNATYTYNAQGLRTSKKVGQTDNFVLVGGNVWADNEHNYTRGIELISNGSQLYLYNVRGDVIQLVGFDGEVDKTYDYDAYGNELQRDNNDENPFRYCGEYYDTETGFIYLRARYYDPMVGRFTSVDPAKDGLNWYSYCGNNPVNLVDPSGLDAILINKPIDHLMVTEHMSAFFQDESENWWFFYWGGSSVRYVQVDDSSIFESLDSINKWLIDYRDPDDPDLRLLNPFYPYRDSVYIEGDFTESHSKALELANSYEKSTSNGAKWNKEYGLLTENCTQVTIELFEHGTLSNGTNVGEYLKSNDYETSALPNTNMNNLQKIFENSATNLNDSKPSKKALPKITDNQNKFVKCYHL